ncbi:uncharacterized protein B0T23DRAFT_196160 [Neurospora hispaniola]|uniref:Uncharacterized protein n=1 Tax=Neurospora hispaniola TaxID=588809 RepID=A0AAJ0I3R6_9PEZI|nr:hypothetical protein B0T23DRAFT_196160 [Neurospora hispaniola]
MKGQMFFILKLDPFARGQSVFLKCLYRKVLHFIVLSSQVVSSCSETSNSFFPAKHGASRLVQASIPVDLSGLVSKSLAKKPHEPGDQGNTKHSTTGMRYRLPSLPTTTGNTPQPDSIETESIVHNPPAPSPGEASAPAIVDKIFEQNKTRSLASALHCVWILLSPSTCRRTLGTATNPSHRHPHPSLSIHRNRLKTDRIDTIHPPTAITWHPDPTHGSASAPRLRGSI